MVCRSYYRCTKTRCNAKKQVERSSEDPHALLITYEGLHLHFAYPYFMPDDSQPINPTIKKAKKTHETQQISQEFHQESPTDLTTPPDLQQQQQLFLSKSLDCPQEWDPKGTVPQGLLEDVVMPFMVPNPFNSTSNTSPNSSSCSSPPPSSPLFWCATHSSACFDIGGIES